MHVSVDRSVRHGELKEMRMVILFDVRFGTH